MTYTCFKPITGRKIRVTKISLHEPVYPSHVEGGYLDQGRFLTSKEKKGMVATLVTTVSTIIQYEINIYH